MVVLLFIALIHGYLIWYGDILFSYAVCGALVFPFRKHKASFLIISGIVVLSRSTTAICSRGTSFRNREGICRSSGPPPNRRLIRAQLRNSRCLALVIPT